MKQALATLLLATALAGGAVAQTAPVGGPDARGNSAIKAPHTVNAGSAKPAANSFTRGQAAKHIEKSGYTGVSGLTKGSDGVWRGSAMKNGAPVSVALDFKGNVTEGMSPAPGRQAARPATPTAAPAADPASVTTGSAATVPQTTITRHSGALHGHRHHGRRHHQHGGHDHANGGVQGTGRDGTAMSGVDSNGSGISDVEKNAAASRQR